MSCTRVFAGVAALLLLAGCGQIRHVFPPAVSIDELAAPPAAAWRATVRLHNQSYDAGVRFDDLELTLSLDGSPAGQLQRAITLDVAARDSDTVRVEFQPTDSMRAKLANADSGALQYTVTGRVTLSDEGKHATNFDIDNQGWLSPMPGIPHHYR